MKYTFLFIATLLFAISTSAQNYFGDYDLPTYSAQKSNATMTFRNQSGYHMTVKILKLAYGKDWMENDTDSITQGKFTKKAFFEKSTESYNFGKKNTGDFVNYSLKINVVDETTENNFTTVSISEDEFNKNY